MILPTTIDYLNVRFRNKWIGRGGPIQWPLRLPDLTSPGFSLWGMLKNLVHKERLTTQEDMKERIRSACCPIPRIVLLKTVDRFHKRLNLCLQANGGNFEQYFRC